jgi:hypothetical protein
MNLAQLLGLSEEYTGLWLEVSIDHARVEDANHNLAMKINQLDEEIDALVYQHYGLTEEEIRVVEGRA